MCVCVCECVCVPKIPEVPKPPKVPPMPPQAAGQAQPPEAAPEGPQPEAGAQPQAPGDAPAEPPKPKPKQPAHPGLLLEPSVEAPDPFYTYPIHKATGEEGASARFREVVGVEKSEEGVAIELKDAEGEVQQVSLDIRQKVYRSMAVDDLQPGMNVRVRSKAETAELPVDSVTVL